MGKHLCWHGEGVSVRWLGRGGELPLLKIAEPSHGCLGCYRNPIAG